MGISFNEHVALVGLGAIVISFAVIYLRYTSAIVSVFDTRSDLKEHLVSVLPWYIDSFGPGVQSLTAAHLQAANNMLISLKSL